MAERLSPERIAELRDKLAYSRVLPDWEERHYCIKVPEFEALSDAAERAERYEKALREPWISGEGAEWEPYRWLNEESGHVAEWSLRIGGARLIVDVSTRAFLLGIWHISRSALDAPQGHDGGEG